MASYAIDSSLILSVLEGMNRDKHYFINYVVIKIFSLAMTPYPFQFDNVPSVCESGENTNINQHPICRGRVPSIQVSQLRAILQEAHVDPNKIVATCCSDDGLGSRLVEEAAFPCVFLGGFMVASSFGLPDTVSLKKT